MPWYSKEQPTPFDSQPITGMTHLHGDLMAERYKQEWVRGKKYPLISFSSGVQRELIPARNAQRESVVHIFGRMQLPLRATCDEAYGRATQITQKHSDYRVLRLTKDIFTVANARARRRYGLQYDDAVGELVSVQLGWNADEMMELLPGEIRAALPPLYANEEQGMKAVAPVKLFTPDANYTWYLTEFDGDDLAFGLVSGDFLELGYFSIGEIEGVRGSLGLPVERDLYYQPKPLAELKALHEQGRSG